MLINLDPTFQPYGAGENFKSFLFSGGEIGLKLYECTITEGKRLLSNRWGALAPHNKVQIITRLTNSNKIMELLMATDAIKRAGFADIELFMGYVPYARQDRVMVPGESLSLKVFADLINSQGYSRVTCFDIHNESTLGLFNNIINISNHSFVHKVLSLYKEAKGENSDNYWLASPDGGALKKIYGLAKHIGAKNILKCDKERDVTNGNILGVSVNRSDLNGWPVYICDDLIDGGATFATLALELRKRNSGNVYLIVSHGIFSKGFDLPNIDHIYVTDSFKTVVDDNVTQIKLDSHLLS